MDQVIASGIQDRNAAVYSHLLNQLQALGVTLDGSLDTEAAAKAALISKLQSMLPEGSYESAEAWAAKEKPFPREYWVYLKRLVSQP